MRIVQVCPYAWSARGGVQVHVRELASQLAARGHQVLVLAPDDADRRAGLDGARRSTEPGAPDVEIVGSCVRIPFNGSIVPICVQPSGARGVRNALARFKPDVVHVHEPLAPSLSLFATWHSQAPVIATFHANCPAPMDALLYQVGARLLRHVSRRVTVRLAVSRAAAFCAESHLGGTMAVVPNGINFDRFVNAPEYPLPAGRKLLVVNRLDRRKGFDVALRAFASIAMRFEDLLLVVVGDGPYRRAVDDLPASLRARVLMLGNVSDEDLPSVYAAADVFVAPATGQESFGLVLLEAMAAGLPIVASDIDGYRDVVRGGTDALLVPPGDAAALGRGVERLLTDELLTARVVISGRTRVKQFSWDRIADSVEQVYRQVAEKTATGDARAPVPSQATQPALDATS